MPDKNTAESIAKARAELGIPDECIPRSIAIIMDGNGRWARQRGLPRPVGHQAGAKVVRKIVQQCANLGIEALALYSFSLENWNRPEEEINALMHLYAEYLIAERPTLIEQNVRLRHLGRREGLPQSVLTELDESVRVTESHTGMYLCLALNYSSRAEIIDAVRRLCEKGASPEQITEQAISDELDTTGIPDPDLLIRTAGELRLSNFMLWQVSYAEFHVTETYWPDFNEESLIEAIRTYAGRNRRFGGVDESNT